MEEEARSGVCVGGGVPAKQTQSKALPTSDSCVGCRNLSGDHPGEGSSEDPQRWPNPSDLSGPCRASEERWAAQRVMDQSARHVPPMRYGPPASAAGVPSMMIN